MRNKDVANAWARGGELHTANYQSVKEGETYALYSYRKRIGILFYTPHGKLYWIWPGRYSVTTTRHQSLALRAVTALITPKLGVLGGETEPRDVEHAMVLWDMQQEKP